MKHVLAAHCAAASSGMLASLTLAALSETGAKTAAGTEANYTFVDAPPDRNLTLMLKPGSDAPPIFAIVEPEATGRPSTPFVAPDMGRRPDLLRRRHSTLAQRDVHLSELRGGGTCIRLNS